MKHTRKIFAWLAAAVFLAPFLAARAGIELALPRIPAKPCGTVTVAAASDLTYAMKEIAAQYEKATGCSVQLSMGSSGNFLTQIENGAPFDMFFSADIAYPKKLEAEGLAAPGSTFLYAIGKIVLWTRNDSRVNVGKGFSVLQDSTVNKIAIANPAHAPYGRAAEEALRKAGVYDSVKNRLVLGENISQAAEFVESGNADVGILALSLALSPAMKDNGRSWNIPENLYAPIEQGAVVVLSSKNQQGAKNFLDYIKLPTTAALLARYGFAPPADSSIGGKH
ncbi:MAG TPA: molybdate ABC transporter substrate-binding protein [Candidatus Acidoferrales bacterium]|nr:molybdate ABC transporter substrate-binding protein [Candidatus Acidoferrales bacterium]